MALARPSIFFALALTSVAPARAHAGEPASLPAAGACAEGFLEFHTQAEARDPRAAETLYRAARCAEAARLPEVASRADELLAERFPKAPEARLALAGVAARHAAAARFARAAEAMERFAGRYADDRRSPDFLVQAAVYRRDLGDDRRAAADLERAEVLTRKVAPARAAAIFWSRRELLPNAHATDAARRTHAEAYLRQYHGVGGPERRLLAAATLGDIAWRSSCARPDGALGLCASFERAAPDTTLAMCAGPATERVTVHARDRELAGAAEAYLKEVVAGEAGALGDPVFAAAVREAAQAARAALDDRDLETYLAVRGPSDLAFEVEEWRKDTGREGDRAVYDKQKKRAEDSQARFIGYYREKTRLAQDLVKRFEATAAARTSPAGTVAATARAAMVTLNYADEGLLFELNSTAGPEVVKAYCKALHDKADALVDGGVKTLSLCLTRASVNGSFGGAARYCEEQLQRRAPLAFPPLQELFAAGQALDPDGETIPVQAQPYDFVELTSGPAPLPAAPH